MVYIYNSKFMVVWEYTRNTTRMKTEKFKGGLKRRLDNADFEVLTCVRYTKPEKKEQIVSKPTLWSKIKGWLDKPIKGL